jgi:hypothetical protein
MLLSNSELYMRTRQGSAAGLAALAFGLGRDVVEDLLDAAANGFCLVAEAACVAALERLDGVARAPGDFGSRSCSVEPGGRAACRRSYGLLARVWQPGRVKATRRASSHIPTHRRTTTATRPSPCRPMMSRQRSITSVLRSSMLDRAAAIDERSRSYLGELYRFGGFGKRSASNAQPRR